MENEEVNLFFDIYNLVFEVESPEIFNGIAEKIVAFLGAFSCSLWISDFEVAGTETRLGYYGHQNSKNIGQCDYDISCKTIADGKSNIDRIADKQKNGWFYISYPFRDRNLIGCYTVWFEGSFENDFREISKKTSTLIRLANTVKNVVSHFLLCRKFDYKRIVRELNTAQKIQSSLIPVERFDIPNVGIGVRSLVAKEVGGDYLDLIYSDNKKLGIAVGDAMGSGVPGAFVMLITRAVFRLLTKTGMEPKAVLEQLNACLTPELVQQNMFISLFYGIYNPWNRNLNYAVAGHNPPIIFRRNNRKIEILEGRGIIIGGRYQTTYNSFSATLEEGDLLLVYTDGVKDVKNEGGKPFGIDGIKRLLSNYAEYDAEGIGNCLAHVLVKYCNNKLNDDASFIILKAE
ncbi:MAG TPA: PP2C family protein-serine/threonine phosphatase [Clostridia bacterium]|nr:PP2C family protein-serine/threonine phosphatase [Clostridia bacterium]